MIPMLNARQVAEDNARHGARAGGATRQLGFRPAFLDCATMQIHPSRFADGTPAPVHVLDGLPDEVVVTRLPSGRVVLAKSTLVCGFERGGFFYTRAAAARACKEWDVPRDGPRDAPLQA